MMKPIRKLPVDVREKLPQIDWRKTAGEYRVAKDSDKADTVQVIELALALASMIFVHRMSVKDAASEFGERPNWPADYLSLLSVAPEVQKLFDVKLPYAERLRVGDVKVFYKVDPSDHQRRGENVLRQRAIGRPAKVLYPMGEAEDPYVCLESPAEEKTQNSVAGAGTSLLNRCFIAIHKIKLRPKIEQTIDNIAALSEMAAEDVLSLMGKYPTLMQLFQREPHEVLIPVPIKVRSRTPRG